MRNLQEYWELIQAQYGIRNQKPVEVALAIVKDIQERLEELRNQIENVQNLAA